MCWCAVRAGRRWRRAWPRRRKSLTRRASGRTGTGGAFAPCRLASEAQRSAPSASSRPDGA
eukprot:8557521-Alexandrium_andersonii.AAC.1